MHVRIHVHQDDYHAWIEGDHVDAAHAQDWLRELLDQGYDVTAVEADGEAWEHYPYGAQWGPSARHREAVRRAQARQSN